MAWMESNTAPLIAFLFGVVAGAGGLIAIFAVWKEATRSKPLPTKPERRRREPIEVIDLSVKDWEMED